MTKQTRRHLIDIKDENWDDSADISQSIGIDSVTNVINILLKEAITNRKGTQKN